MYVVYPAVFYKNKDDQGYTVVFPDFDNGATEGRDLLESYEMASDYVGSWLYEYYIDNKVFPDATDIKNIIIEDDDYSIKEDSFVTLIGLNMTEYVKKSENRTVRRNVSIPSYLNELAKNKNINVSQLLQDALKQELNL